MLNNWKYIKSVAAHLGADYGWQSSHVAIHKNTDNIIRLEHVSLIGLSHLIAVMTMDNMSTKSKIQYLVVNIVSHYMLDSFRLPKWLDQSCHILICLLSVKLGEYNDVQEMARSRQKNN